MMHEPAAMDRPPIMQCLLQRIEHEARMRRARGSRREPIVFRTNSYQSGSQRSALGRRNAGDALGSLMIANNPLENTRPRVASGQAFG
jgi:hypothetical protein